MIDRTEEHPEKPITLEEIFDEFEFLGDSEAQMDYLIDLGLDMPKLPDSAKTEQNFVHGCQSQVWMLTEFEENDDSRLDLQAESDAMIVSGLIAILIAAYHRKTPEEILELDIHGIFDRLGLDRHLSPQRKNGLNGMVNRILQAARVEQAG